MKEDIYARAADILDQLREIELAIADLYRRFASAFSADRAFWQDLAREEDHHAALAEELKRSLLKNGSPFEVAALNPTAVAAFRHSIDLQLARLERSEVGRREALFVAKDFERGLIERRLYESVRSEKRDYRASQEKIRRQTEEHYQKLQNYILTVFR